MNQKQTVSLEIVLKGIKPIDEEAVKAAKAHWDRVAKPLNSLGGTGRGYLPCCRCKAAGRVFSG